MCSTGAPAPCFGSRWETAAQLNRSERGGHFVVKVLLPSFLNLRISLEESGGHSESIPAPDYLILPCPLLCFINY